MPIYEYQCQECDHTLDALQKISEDRLVDCPECGLPGLKRLLSAPRFRLKGNGWYETDFKTGDKRNLASSDSGKGDAGESKAESKDMKAESKANKTESKDIKTESKAKSNGKSKGSDEGKTA